MKVLLIRFSSAGDILISGELIKRLKADGHEVHFLTKKKFADAAAAAGADKVHVPLISKPADYLAAAAELSKGDFEALIDLHKTPRSVFMSFLIKAKKKAACQKNPLKRRLMAAFKWFLGGKIQSVSTGYIRAAEKAVGELKTVLQKPKYLKKNINILIHTGAKWTLKRWPYFEALVKVLAKNGTYRITVTGVKDEVENYNEMIYDGYRNVKDKTGKTTFKTLLAEIKKADLFIGNDTAAAHAAKLYGVPAVILLGPTVREFGFITAEDFRILENSDLLCRPCHVHGGNNCKTGGFECMRSISRQAVIKEIQKYIKTAGRNG